MTQSNDVEKTMAEREELLDELNILVTGLGPDILNRGMPLNEALKAIISCLKNLQAHLKASVEKQRLLQEQLDKYLPRPPVECSELEGVPI